MPARLGLRLLAALQAFLLLGSLILPALAAASVWTDQADYSPGSVVTITGDNSNGAGYLPGETVDVAVIGPNDYTAACNALADDTGAWSCQVTLWNSNLAWGQYTYVATGQTSGATESGTFTDALNLQSRESTCSTETNSFASGATVCMRATGIGGPFPKSGEFKWWAPGLNPASDAATRTQAFTTPNSNVTDSFAPDACGMWTVRVYQPAGSVDTAEDTFAVTGCAVATSTSISAPTITYNANGSVTVTVTATSGTPSGTVGLSVDAGPAVSKALSSGSAIFSNSDLAALSSPNAGDHTLSAAYAAQAGFAASSATATLHVDKADVTATAGSGSAPYDGATHTPSACAVTGAYTGDLTCINSPASVGPSAGTTTISPIVSGTGLSNYDIDLVDGSFVITPVDPTCSVNGFSGPYDGLAHGATLVNCYGVGGPADVLAGTFSSTDFSDVPGGTASWSFDPTSGNYNTKSGTASIVITPVDPTCDIVGFTGDYDGDAHGATNNGCYGVGGPSDILAGLFISTDFANVPGGTASWSFDPTSGNYSTTTGTASIVITPVDPTCSVNGFSGPFDGLAHGATLVSCYGVGGSSDILTGAFISTDFTDVPGGTASWSFDPTSGNYNTETGTAVITINPIDATCDIVGFTGDYDGDAHGASGTCYGLGGPTDLLGTVDYGHSFANVPGGTANWTFTSDSPNYNDDSGSVAITLNPIEASCAIIGGTFDYDGNANGASGSCLDLDGNPLSGLDLGDSFTDVPGGTAYWTFDSPSANYNDASGTALIIINPIDANCTIIGYDVVLDGASHTATGSCLDIDGNALSGLDLSGTSHSTVGVFSDGWTFTSPSDNYNDAVGSVVDKIHYATAGLCLGSPGHQILQPIDSLGTSIFKQGSTVPAKFRVCDALGHSIGTPGVVTDFRLVGITGAAAGTVNEVVDSTTPDTAFRWSASDQQWIFNVSTKALTKNKTYEYRITLNDDSYIYFSFSLK